MCIGDDHHSGFYDGEILLALDASNPWFLDKSTTPVSQAALLVFSVWRSVAPTRGVLTRLSCTP